MSEPDALDSAVLGRLLLLQSAVEAAPNDERLGQMLCHGLERVPGIASCSVEFVQAHPRELSKTSTDLGILRLLRLELQTAFAVYGYLELEICDPEAFAPYMPFVANTANIVTMRIENRSQAEELERLNNKLEAQVALRTAELERERANLAALADNTDDTIWSVDRDYCLLVGNAAFSAASERVTGRPLQPGECVIAPDGKGQYDSQWREYYDRALAGETFEYCTFQPTIPSRRYFWFRTSPIRDAPGAVVGATVHGHDITEQRASWLGSQRRKRFVSALLETVPALIYVYDLEVNANTYANSGIERLLGYSPEYLRSLGPDIFTKLIHSDDLPKVFDAQERLRLGRGDTMVEIEYRVRHADGSWRIHHSLERPFERDHEGLVTKKIGVALDVTDQVSTEQALRESEQRFRQVYEQQAVGIASVGLDNHILGANQAYCEMLGYTENELVGMHLAEITAPEAKKENLALQAALSRGETDHYRMEKRFHHKDGHTVIGILDANLVRDAQGQPAYALGSVLDITERVRAMQELEENNAELERFNRAAVGRELRMIELKEEINSLSAELGRRRPYRSGGTSY